MPGALGSIGSIFGSAAPALTGISAAGGLVGNILNAITRGKAIGSLESAQKKFAGMTPEQLSGLVSRAEAPLSQDLLQNVGNLVQADMASRGLAQAPGIFAASESQALAPYKLAEQQKALQLVMTQLGLPIEYAQAILQGTQGGSDVSQALLMLMLRNAQDGSTGGDGGVTGGTPPIIDPNLTGETIGGMYPVPTTPTFPDVSGSIGDLLG